MASRRQKYRFYHFCLRGVCLGIFEHFFHVCKDNTSTDKSPFKKMQFLAISGGFKFCFTAVIFSLFKHFPEAEMTWSQLIIVRECIFKNQNLCFASR